MACNCAAALDLVAQRSIIIIEPDPMLRIIHGAFTLDLLRRRACTQPRL